MPGAKVEHCNSLNLMTRDVPPVNAVKPGESPVHWIQFLHDLDQQGSNAVSMDLKAESWMDERYISLESGGTTTTDMNGPQESEYSSKDIGSPPKARKAVPDRTSKVPDAVVAFAQAAAKANGEPEKYFLGWPLLMQSKVHLQKCDKCSREFCSPINYRRHARVHRKSLNVNKDSSNNRALLGAFWEKLSLDEEKEIVSLKDVTVGEVTGSSIVWVLASLIRKPGISSLPHSYVKAGMTLVDLIHGIIRFPLSSQELFRILDDASEKTFMCAGTALSLQKFLFDGESGRIALELKNLVACTSFMVEYKLVKAWLTDKDAEALRCQKLLFEEEEAAQKRQAELLERKRMKKIRQKEQRAKEAGDVAKIDSNAPSLETIDSSSPETPSPREEDPLELNLDYNAEASPNQVCPSIGTTLCSNNNGEFNFFHEPYSETVNHIMSHKKQLRSVRWKPTSVGNQTSKSSKYVPNGLHSVQTKHGSSRELKLLMPANGNKIWAPKAKPGKEGDSSMEPNQEETENSCPSSASGNCEVLIGSISVTIKDGGLHEKPANYDLRPIKWRPVSRFSNGCYSLVDRDFGTKLDISPTASTGCSSPDEGFEFCSEETEVNETYPSVLSPTSKTRESSDGSRNIPFSADIAMAFLAQRWNSAISEDHVTLSCYAEATSPAADAYIITSANTLISTEFTSRAKLEKTNVPKYIPEYKSSDTKG